MSEKVIGDKSIESLLAELASIKTKGDAGLTVAEMSASSGKTVKTVQRLLQLAKLEGRLTVGRRPSERIDGVPSAVPVYRISPGKRTK